jgi:tRNA A58 N-methylase Trm61
MEAKKSKTKGYSRMFVDWRPYNTHCNFCNVPFKVISKTETFEDRSKILEMLEVEDEKKKDRIHVHTGDQTYVVTKELFSNISDTVKQDLLILYQYDFALFGYDTGLY